MVTLAHDHRAFWRDIGEVLNCNGVDGRGGWRQLYRPQSYRGAMARHRGELRLAQALAAVDEDGQPVAIVVPLSTAEARAIKARLEAEVRRERLVLLGVA